MSNLKQTIDNNPLLLVEAIIENNVTEIAKNINAFTGVIVQPSNDVVFDELVNISRKDTGSRDLLNILNVPIIEDNLSEEGIEFVAEIGAQYKSTTPGDQGNNSTWGNIVSIGLSGIVLALNVAANNNANNTNTPPPPSGT